MLSRLIDMVKMLGIAIRDNREINEHRPLFD